MSYGTPPPSDPYGQPPQPPEGGGYGGGYGAPGGQPSSKGFFGALFDFSFDHFVTPMIVKVVYILSIVALGVGWLVFLAAGFANNAGAGLFILLIGPVGILLYLCLIRMTLEFYLAVTRMSQDIHQRLK